MHFQLSRFYTIAPRAVCNPARLDSVHPVIECSSEFQICRPTAFLKRHLREAHDAGYIIGASSPRTGCAPDVSSLNTTTRAYFSAHATSGHRQVRASAGRPAMRVAVYRSPGSARNQVGTLETGLDCAESLKVTSGAVADRFSSPLWSNWSGRCCGRGGGEGRGGWCDPRRTRPPSAGA
jgi:hypothetical protein